MLPQIIMIKSTEKYESGLSPNKSSTIKPVIKMKSMEKYESGLSG